MDVNKEEYTERGGIRVWWDPRKKIMQDTPLTTRKGRRTFAMTARYPSIRDKS